MIRRCKRCGNSYIPGDPERCARCTAPPAVSVSTFPRAWRPVTVTEPLCRVCQTPDGWLMCGGGEQCLCSCHDRWD